jgi:tRNA(Ile)-lysidine synthase
VKRRAAPDAGGGVAPPSFTAPWLAQRLRQLAGPLAGARLCVAYSGGADSTALLAAAAALRVRCRCELRALHVNHHLQPGADAWARAARATALRLGVPCRLLDAPVTVARGESPEAAARSVRYAALRGALRPGEWLLLAQHQDDQVETLLLQLLRGAGIAGLAAMPASAGPLLRPLLEVTRAQLQAYLRRRGIGWSEDPSNLDERFDRNYLRQRVLPLLRARWPALGITVSRSARLAAEAQRLLAAQADAALHSACDGAALSVSVLRRLNEPERRNALRRWLELRGLPMPDQRRLQEIAGPMLRARFDAQPCISWPGGQVRRHGALLHAQAAATAPPRSLAPSAAGAPLTWHWLRDARLNLPGGACLELLPAAHGDLLRAALPARVTVAFRSADGSVGPRPGGRRVKRLLHKRSLPPWQRGAVPLIYAGRRLIAVGDSWRAPELSAAAADAARAAPGAGGGAARARLQWRAGA